MKRGGLKVRAYHTTNQHLPNRAIQALVQKPLKRFSFSIHGTLPWGLGIVVLKEYKYHKDVYLWVVLFI